MDEVFIKALVQQAIGAYKAGGDEGLKHWMEALPPPHLEAFKRDCDEPLQKAIATLQAGWAQQQKAVEAEEETDPRPPTPDPLLPDPRKKHTRDQRRTKPL